MKRLLLVFALAVTLLVAVMPAPAGATVHEIVAAWCNGQDPLEPHGISGGSNASNFGQPLFAGGVVQVVPYPAGGANAVLIDFDFSKPQMKIVPTGAIVPIVPGALYIEDFTLDPSHPAFGNCKKLNP